MAEVPRKPQSVEVDAQGQPPQVRAHRKVYNYGRSIPPHGSGVEKDWVRND